VTHDTLAGERGSATVLVLAGVMACCVAGGLWLASGRAALARQHAETAADLAALAGAQALNRLAASPCLAAAQTATANGGLLLTCTVAGDSVAVTVAVDRPMAARAAARAGPENPQ
jgi:secretion/DNA translocation related TadE-like protein